MAKLINGLLGNSKNKVGNLVTYVAKGQQLARTKAANIANPRTELQMTQRVKMANVVSMYRLNRPWMDRLAFENKKQTWSVFNAFVSANLTNNTIALTKQESQAGAVIVAEYQMTDGSLPQIVIDSVAPNRWKSNLNVGDLESLDTATIGDLSTALLANNNGLSAGMQVSFVMNYQQQASGIYRAFSRYYELIINASDTRPVSAVLDTNHVDVVDGTIGYIAGDSDPYAGFTFILSQTISGKTRVSPSFMVVTDTGLVSTYSDATQVAAAIASYGGGDTSPFLAEGYQTSSNPDVPVNISILGAGLTTPLTAVGGYIGNVGGEGAFNLLVGLSATPSETPTSVVIYADGYPNYAVQSASLTMTGSTINASFTGGNINPNAAIIQVVVNLAGGVAINASFARTDGGDSGVIE